MNESVDSYGQLEEALGHSFADPSLLVRALTHSSFANDEQARGVSVKDNETLEFLGDSILNFLVGEQLYEAYPDFREGALSKARSHLVSEGTFAIRARELGLGRFLRLTAAESRAGGRVKDSILADAFEAVFAALYLDAGLGKTRETARRLFREDVAALDPGDLSYHDHKTALQELLQAEGRALPIYRLVAESGPDHLKSFVYEVDCGTGLVARGEGKTKKEAQRQAAKAALSSFRS